MKTPNIFIEKLWRKFIDTEGDKKKVQIELKDDLDSKSDLQDKTPPLNEILRQKEKQKETLEAKLSSCDKTLNKEIEGRKALEAELKECKEYLEEVRAEKEKAKKILERMQRDCKALEGELIIREKALGQIREKSKEIQIKTQTLLKNLGDIKEEKETLEKKHLEIKQEKEELGKKIISSTLELEEVKKEYLALQAELERLTQDINTFSQENGSIKKYIEGQQGQIAELVRQWKDSLEHKKKLNEELETIKTKKSKLETEKEFLQAEKRKLKNQEDKLQKAAEKINDSYQATQEAEANLIKELEKSEDFLVEKKEKFPKQEVLAPSQSVIESSLDSLPNMATREEEELGGKVYVVNEEFGFVVVNLGDVDRVQKGESFGVYRNGEMIGEVEITEVNDKISFAAIKKFGKGQHIKTDDIVKYISKIPSPLSS